ncbi:methyltransferase [Colletotrichum higginsianum]|nr:methyltransferase [Colletotrichum higginsianum]
MSNNATTPAATGNAPSPAVAQAPPAEYTLPNDDQEHDRLDLQHNMFIRSFHDKLGTAPPNELGAKVGRVLDVGTGSGIWAIDFGDDHPEADPRALNLRNANRSNSVPPNVKFEVDDVEESWTFSQPFDYIHSRLMTGSISNWEKYIRECYKLVLCPPQARTKV